MNRRIEAESGNEIGHKAQQSGFTLVELLVSLMLF
ncbi:MAG: type II secretion system protein, partial [Acidobacteria bacterium]|nr:type II secretion system protein [Acidobacteriota bacterium]